MLYISKQTKKTRGNMMVAAEKMIRIRVTHLFYTRFSYWAWAQGPQAHSPCF
ncbi:hypothetical protein HanRHA438_Chr11g0515351 [Helianthus annuus]|nr:hypothetical protein HanRHA438_Chr11g0515351 [Helianthus annuus]